MIQNFKDDWKALDPKMKALFVAIAIGGAGFWYVNHQKNVEFEKQADDAKIAAAKAKAQATDGGDGSLIGDPNHLKVLPTNNRNQGLEDLTAEIQQLREALQRMQGNNAGSPSYPNSTFNEAPVNATPGSVGGQPTTLQPGVNMDSKLPAVSFDAPEEKGTPSSALKQEVPQQTAQYQPEVEVPRQKVWESKKPTSEKTNGSKEKPALIIPVNAALESVMLSGINARPSGSSGGAVGTVQAATSVGSPFVTRLKGNAILPNGYKVANLGDCFLGGNGIANLSAERVNVISDTISCIAPDGREWEGKIRAYGLDVDGTQGIAGHVVSKQGTILMQAALTGVASGLSSAFSPSSVPSYNSTSTGGTQQYSMPNPNMLMQSAVGQGMNQATAALSKFYLQYASETFPVIEVVAGTRITWILQESVELKLKHGARQS